MMHPRPRFVFRFFGVLAGTWLAVSAVGAEPVVRFVLPPPPVAPEPVVEEDLFADMAPKIRKQKKVFIGSGESRPLTQFQASYQIKASFLKGTGSVKQIFNAAFSFC